MSRSQPAWAGSRVVDFGTIAVAIGALTIGCKAKPKQQPPAPTPSARLDAAATIQPSTATDATVADGANRPWTAQFAQLPWIEATRTIKLPIRADQPRFDVVGPIIVGDLAVVGSSQFGFTAIRWRDGATAWTKPAGLHLAPPLVVDDNLLLLADCVKPPTIDESQELLGCLRTVSRSGNDLSFAAVVTTSALASQFASVSGPSKLWAITGSRLAWQRGDVVLEFDPLAPLAKRSTAEPPVISATINNVAVTFAHTDEAVLALDNKGKEQWRVGGRFAAVLGIVTGAAHESPMLRVARIGTRFNPRGEIDVLDIDATGSRHGQAAFPTPGIALLGSAVAADGACALASRVDTSLTHDLIVGYDAQARQRWVFALPEIPRADPVGLAFAPDAVLAFFDGDTLAVLPKP